MDRRSAVVVMGAGMVGIHAVASASARGEGHAQPPADPGAERNLMLEWERCAAACSSCAASCDAAIPHALRMLTEGDKGLESACRLLVDCSQVCAISSAFCARRSDQAPSLCAACAE